jgi:7,8-dihydropterin-6-yl-methyl-4-(beta-D-ribofuranosyl)aminobenzene 5'-phosphate synthase
MSQINLRQADRLEVTVLVDNYTDLLLLQGSDVVRRPMFAPPLAPLAEHGLACLLKVCAGDEEHVVLMDAGISPACLLHNASLLSLDRHAIEAVALSHGHFDHFGGLLELLGGLRRGTPVVLHPDAFLERRIKIPGSESAIELPRLDEAAVTRTGAIIDRRPESSTIAAGLLLLTGEVQRVTEFERGFPWAEAKVGGKWVADPFHDDQGLVAHVKDRGLVVLGGCSHAGIINTVKYAQQLAGTERVHAVLGGFHLSGPLFEPIIAPTVKAMKSIGPDYVVPMHCTGCNAIDQFAAEMPAQFIRNSVGTSYVFA